MHDFRISEEGMPIRDELRSADTYTKEYQISAFVPGRNPQGKDTTNGSEK